MGVEYSVTNFIPLGCGKRESGGWLNLYGLVARHAFELRGHVY